MINGALNMSDSPSGGVSNANAADIGIGQPDALSSLLIGLQLHGEVYVSGSFCGAWAVDTSGKRHIPFHLVSAGRAWLHIEGQPSRVLNAGDLVLFPRDLSHTISHSEQPPAEELVNAGFDPSEPVTTEMVCGYFDFTNKAAWPLLESLDDVIVLDLSQQSLQPVLRAFIDYIVAELKQRNPGFLAVVNQLVYLLFVQVIRQQIESGRLKEGLLVALFDPKISKALAAIHNQPQQNWSLVSLAQEASMGRSSFAALFQKLVGMPAMRYLTLWRMREATELLKYTNRSMLDIAEQCGYESEAAFRKAYKQTMGDTPGAVRKSAKP